MNSFGHFWPRWPEYHFFGSPKTYSKILWWFCYLKWLTVEMVRNTEHEIQHIYSYSYKNLHAKRVCQSLLLLLISICRLRGLLREIAKSFFSRSDQKHFSFPTSTFAVSLGSNMQRVLAIYRGRQCLMWSLLLLSVA